MSDHNPVELYEIDYDKYIKEWLQRAKRATYEEKKGEADKVDDGDRFLSLWIAFNSWMKGYLPNGEGKTDKKLIDYVKKSDMKKVFETLKKTDKKFMDNLTKFETFVIRDLKQKKSLKYGYESDYNEDLEEGNPKVADNKLFESFIDIIYTIRCNLFHGTKVINTEPPGTKIEDTVAIGDYLIVIFAYKLLLPLFEEYLRESKPEVLF